MLKREEGKEQNNEWLLILLSVSSIRFFGDDFADKGSCYNQNSANHHERCTWGHLGLEMASDFLEASAQKLSIDIKALFVQIKTESSDDG